MVFAASEDALSKYNNTVLVFCDCASLIKHPAECAYQHYNFHSRVPKQQDEAKKLHHNRIDGCDGKSETTGQSIGRGEQSASADLQARELIKRRKAKARPQVSRVYVSGKQVFRGAAVAQQFKDIPQTPLMSAR
jgi:hypothetical protein